MTTTYNDTLLHGLLEKLNRYKTLSKISFDCKLVHKVVNQQLVQEYVEDLVLDLEINKIIVCPHCGALHIGELNSNIFGNYFRCKQCNDQYLRNKEQGYLVEEPNSITVKRALDLKMLFYLVNGKDLDYSNISTLCLLLKLTTDGKIDEDLLEYPIRFIDRVSDIPKYKSILEVPYTLESDLQVIKKYLYSDVNVLLTGHDNNLIITRHKDEFIAQFSYMTIVDITFMFKPYMKTIPVSSFLIKIGSVDNGELSYAAADFHEKHGRPADYWEV